MERGEILHIDFEKILPTPKCLPDSGCRTEHALYYYLMTTGKEDMVDRWLSYRQLLSMDIYKDKTKEELSDYKIRGEEIFNIALQMEPLIGTIGGYVIGAQNGTPTKRTLKIILMVM